MRLGRATSYALTSLALASAVGASVPASADARPRSSSVNEYGKLAMQDNKGSTIEEKGIGWGSFNCSVLISLTVSGTLVTSQYTAYLSGGSITGTAIAHIHTASTEAAQFSGTITLSRGTGSRSRASGTASFSGTINRTTYAMTTHINGKLRL
jgi:hypothetical protein